MTVIIVINVGLGRTFNVIRLTAVRNTVVIILIEILRKYICI